MADSTAERATKDRTYRNFFEGSQSRKKFLSEHQERWQLPWELRPSGAKLKKAAEAHTFLRGKPACQFCLSWTNSEVLRAPEAQDTPKEEPLTSKTAGVHYTLLHKHEQLIQTLVKRWQSWTHGVGPVVVDQHPELGGKKVVHAKYCKSVCPNGHYALPNGLQMHGVYEGTREQLLTDMHKLQDLLLSVPDGPKRLSALFVAPAPLPLPSMPPPPEPPEVPPEASFRAAVRLDDTSFPRPRAPDLHWKTPHVRDIPTLRRLAAPPPLLAPLPGPFPPKPSAGGQRAKRRPHPSLPLGGAGGEAGDTSPRQEIASWGLQLGLDAIPDGLQLPALAQPPSGLPMISPPGPIGYVEGHRPLFVLDVGADGSRLELMKQIMLALLSPGGEVAQFTERFGVVVTGEQLPWCDTTCTTPAACAEASRGVQSLRAQGGGSLVEAIRTAHAKARPADLSNNKWVHMLADVIYVVSDGAARAAPIERLVNQLKLLPDLVPIHCVGIRPEDAGRNLLHWISGSTGGTYVECDSCDVTPQTRAQPFQMLSRCCTSQHINQFLEGVSCRVDRSVRAAAPPPHPHPQPARRTPTRSATSARRRILDASASPRASPSREASSSGGVEEDEEEGGVDYVDGGSESGARAGGRYEGGEMLLEDYEQGDADSADKSLVASLSSDSGTSSSLDTGGAGRATPPHSPAPYKVLPPLYVEGNLQLRSPAKQGAWGSVRDEMDALCPVDPQEVFSQQLELQKFYCEWSSASGTTGGLIPLHSTGFIASSQAMQQELVAKAQGDNVRQEAALLLEAVGWVHDAVDRIRRANLQYKGVYQRVDCILMDPGLRDAYQRDVVAAYRAWAKGVQAVAYAEHYGRTDFHRGRDEFHRRWREVESLITMTGDDMEEEQLYGRESLRKMKENLGHYLSISEAHDHEEHTRLLTNSLSARWQAYNNHAELKQKQADMEAHYREQIRDLNQAHERDIEDVVLTRKGYLLADCGEMEEALCTSDPEMEEKMKGLHEKFSEDAKSVDLACWHQAESRGLPTTVQEAQAQLQTPALMEGQLQKWAEIFSTRVSRMNSLQQQYVAAIVNLLERDKDHYNQTVIEVNNHNQKILSRHNQLVRQVVDGCAAIADEAEGRYMRIWEEHIVKLNEQDALWKAANSQAIPDILKRQASFSSVTTGVNLMDLQRHSPTRAETHRRAGPMGCVSPSKTRAGSAQQPLQRWSVTGGGRSSPSTLTRPPPSVFITPVCDVYADGSPMMPLPTGPMVAGGAYHHHHRHAKGPPKQLHFQTSQHGWGGGEVGEEGMRVSPDNPFDFPQDGSPHRSTPDVAGEVFLPPSPPPGEMRPLSPHAHSRPGSPLKRTRPRCAQVRTNDLAIVGSRAASPSRSELGLQTSRPRSPYTGGPNGIHYNPWCSSPPGKPGFPPPYVPTPAPPIPPPEKQPKVPKPTRVPPQQPVVETSEVLYGDESPGLAWMTELEEVIPDPMSVFEEFWEHGLRVASWRHTFNDYGVAEEARRRHEAALQKAAQEHKQALISWEERQKFRISEVTAKSDRLVAKWRAAYEERMRELEPQIQRAEGRACRSGFGWAERQGVKHVITHGCQQDPTKVYAEIPMTYEIAQIGEARARSKQAETELNHINEMLVLFENYADSKDGLVANKTITEKIVDVVTFTYRLQTPFAGVVGHHNGFFDPRRAPCHRSNYESAHTTRATRKCSGGTIGRKSDAFSIQKRSTSGVRQRPASAKALSKSAGVIASTPSR